MLPRRTEFPLREHTEFLLRPYCGVSIRECIETLVRSLPISHIVALVGDSAYLPCDISTTHEGDSVHLVLWYREDLGTSVYSIDARNPEGSVPERWSDDNVFSHRAYFMLDKQPAQLGVENTREEDAGIYRCRVDFQIGQTRNSKVNLTVIGKPAPTVSWYRNDRFVTNRTTLRKGVTRSEIVIQNLSREDVHSLLTCNATNNNRSIPLSSSVRVDMKCKYPPTSADGNTTTSVLSFMATKADAGRHLSCQAENRIMGNAPIEDGWVLQIQYTPETQIQLGTSLNPNAIREGTDVYFDCLIQAEPPVYKVEWRHQ
ncbi:hypothetical protein P5V15_002273, partial [Pogonomyrmex californicus]